MNMREKPCFIADSPKSLDIILFPGNTSKAPQLINPVLQFSMDYTGLNSDGSYFAEGDVLMRGYALPYSQANLRENLIPNYTIVNKFLSFDGLMFNDSWATQRIVDQRDQLGLAFHPFATNSASSGVNNVFRKLGITIPTSSLANTKELTDQHQFPLDFTTVSGPAVIALVTARFFDLYGWKKAAFIYSEGSEESMFYEVFVNVSAQYKIEIIQITARPYRSRKCR